MGYILYHLIYHDFLQAFSFSLRTHKFIKETINHSGFVSSVGFRLFWSLLRSLLTLALLWVQGLELDLFLDLLSDSDGSALSHWKVPYTNMYKVFRIPSLSKCVSIYCPTEVCKCMCMHAAQYTQQWNKIESYNFILAIGPVAFSQLYHSD